MAAEYTPLSFTSPAGGEDTFTPLFEFISTDHIEVYLDDVLLALTTDYSWQAGSLSILLVTPLLAGETLEMHRVTPFEDTLVSYSKGAFVTDANLDLANDQLLYIINENAHANVHSRELVADVSVVGAASLQLRLNDWPARYNHMRIEYLGVYGVLAGFLRTTPVDSGVGLSGVKSMQEAAGLFNIGSEWQTRNEVSNLPPGTFGQADIYWDPTKPSVYFLGNWVTFVYTSAFPISYTTRGLTNTTIPIVRADGFDVSIVGDTITGRCLLWGYPHT